MACEQGVGVRVGAGEEAMGSEAYPGLPGQREEGPTGTGKTICKTRPNRDRKDHMQDRASGQKQAYVGKHSASLPLFCASKLPSVSNKSPNVHVSKAISIDPANVRAAKEPFFLKSRRCCFVPSAAIPARRAARAARLGCRSASGWGPETALGAVTRRLRARGA
eukprot:3944170-Pleurochrysis_carterae.AAC.2